MRYGLVAIMDVAIPINICPDVRISISTDHQPSDKERDAPDVPANRIGECGNCTLGPCVDIDSLRYSQGIILYDPVTRRSTLAHNCSSPVLRHICR